MEEHIQLRQFPVFFKASDRTTFGHFTAVLWAGTFLWKLLFCVLALKLPAIKRKFEWPLKAGKQLKNFKKMYACWLSATMTWDITIHFKVTGLVKDIPWEPTEQQKKLYYIPNIPLFYYWAVIMFGSTSWETTTPIFPIRHYFLTTKAPRDKRLDALAENNVATDYKK